MTVPVVADLDRVILRRPVVDEDSEREAMTGDTGRSASSWEWARGKGEDTK